MAHHNEENHNLSPIQIQYNDCIKRGNEFLNISQYLSAKECFLEAKELNVDNNYVDEKLAEIVKLQKYERKTVIKILVAAAIVVGAIYLFKYII